MKENVDGLDKSEQWPAWSAIERSETREEEMAYAKKHCRITKIAGWFLVGIFILELVASFFPTYRVETNIGQLIGAFFILQGSQAWIRIYLFFSGGGLFMGFASFLWSILIQEPFETQHGTFYFDQLGLVKATAYPVMIVLLYFVLFLAVLKARKLKFWTQATWLWAGIVLAIWLVAGVGTMLARYQSSTKVAKFAADNEDVVQLVEEYARKYGATKIGGSENKELNEALRQIGREDPILFKRHTVNGGSTTSAIFHQGSYSYGSHDDYDYRKTIKSQTGEWIIVLMNFDKEAD